MLKRIANATVIHGVKEAWHAGRLGRIFYAIVFTICFVLMFFQLKGIFQAYLNESIGTRLTNPTTLEDTEVPSFYYCNDMWFPNLLGVNQLIRSEGGIPNSMADDNLALHMQVLRSNDTVYPIDRFWRLTRIQELINGMVMVPERGHFDKLIHAGRRPLSSSYNYYARAHHDMSEMLKKLFGRSLQNAVESNLIGSGAHAHTQATPICQMHGIATMDFSLPKMKNSSISTYEYYSVYQTITKLSNRCGKPRLSLDGICWEFSLGPRRKKTEQVAGEKNEHVVTHYGGRGHHLEKLVHAYLSAPGTQGITSISAAVYNAIFKVLRYTWLLDLLYATHISIARQDEPHLLFDQKIRIDRKAQRVLIKYWMKKSVHIARKGRPCRSQWSTLDQAHCNQNLARERDNLICEQYLPASSHFPETNVTRQTCIHDHTGLFEVAKSAAAKQSIVSRRGFPLPLISTSRQQMVRNLTANSAQCPRPCSKTIFQFETTYPTASVGDQKYLCMAALASFFVPLEDIHQVWFGNRTHEIYSSQSYVKGDLYTKTSKLLAFYTQVRWWDWPCSVVEYERSEINGQVSDEYFLYSLADLAASVGGTVGLWAGASVLSIVQILYLCCLKKLFKRLQRRSFSRLTRLIRFPEHCKGRGKNEHHQYRSSNKPPLRLSMSSNRVHHI